jgi:hypothetical protein
MGYSDPRRLVRQLRRARFTANRLRHDGFVEMRPGRIVLRGQATTYFVKLAAEGRAPESLPQICLKDSLSVASVFGGPPRAA